MKSYKYTFLKYYIKINEKEISQKYDLILIISLIMFSLRNSRIISSLYKRRFLAIPTIYRRDKHIAFRQMHRRKFHEFVAARILENAPTTTKADAEEVKKRKRRSKEKRKNVKEGVRRAEPRGPRGKK